MKTQFKDLKDLDRFEAEVLAAIPVEKRLRGVPVAERLRGVPVEERLRGLSREEIVRLKKLLSSDAAGKKRKRR